MLKILFKYFLYYNKNIFFQISFKRPVFFPEKVGFNIKFLLQKNSWCKKFQLSLKIADGVSEHHVN